MAQTVEADSLVAARQTAVSPAQLLEGRISGVRVSGTDGAAEQDVLTNIRGLNSIRGTQPLWIVDGAVINDPQFCNQDPFSAYEGAPSITGFCDINFLSPYQIESIQVLKDISSTAEYGARGANGVIIVRTKKATQDRRNIELHSNLVLNTASSGTSFAHNHTLFLDQALGKVNYSIGAFYRHNSAVNGGSGGDNGGIRAQFETKSSSFIHFGFNTVFAFGESRGTVQDAGDENSLSRYRSVSSVYLDLNFLPWLKWKNTAGADYADDTRYLWYDNGSSFGKACNGAAAISYGKRLGANFESRLLASGYVGGDHNLGGELGISLDYIQNNCNLQCDTGFVDHSLGARGIEFANGKDIPCRTSTSATQLALLGRFSYGYKDIINFNALLNASNTAKYDGNGNFNFYPSVDASVDLRNAFFHSFTAVSKVALKGGWGTAGREYYIPTQDYGSFTSVPYVDIPRSQMVYYDALNRLRTSEWHAGIDLSFISDRITLGVGYYDRSTDDALTLYFNGEVDEKTGSISWADRKVQDSNSATVRNNGVEVDLSADIVRCKDWLFNLYADFAYNVNVIAGISDAEQYGRAVCGYVPNAEVLGRSVSVFAGYQTDPVTGGPLDKTGDGRITAADKVVLGNSVPLVHGGFGFNLNWHNLKLEAAFDGAAGFNLLDMDAMLADNALDVMDAYICKGDYLRMQSLSLSYEFKFPNVTWIQGIGVELSGHNLFTVCAKGVNPYSNSFGSNTRSYGIGCGAIATAPGVVLGFSFKF